MFVASRCDMAGAGDGDVPAGISSTLRATAAGVGCDEGTGGGTSDGGVVVRGGRRSRCRARRRRVRRRRAEGGRRDVRWRSPGQDRGGERAPETANDQDQEKKPGARAVGTNPVVGTSPIVGTRPGVGTIPVVGTTSVVGTRPVIDRIVRVVERLRDSERAILGVELTANRIDCIPVTLREGRCVIVRSAALPYPPTVLHPTSLLRRQACARHHASGRRLG